MKLSEMSTKQLAAALCRLTEPVGNITKDESLNGVFERIAKRVKSGGYMSDMEKMGMLLEAVPVLLDSHYADTIRIAAIMMGRSDAEVEALNGYEMIDEMRKCIDSQFMSFFRSSAAMGQTEKVKGE